MARGGANFYTAEVAKRFGLTPPRWYDVLTSLRYQQTSDLSLDQQIDVCAHYMRCEMVDMGIAARGLIGTGV